MPRFTVHAVAPDRPGIVAAVTESLADVGCNLQDSRMMLLHGQFSMVIVLDAPNVSNGMVIEEALSPLLEEYALELLVRPISDSAETGEVQDLIAISIHGADHPGTISRITKAIADSGGNVVDLVGHVILEGSDVPSHLEITTAIEPGAVHKLRAALDQLAAELAMQCLFREGTTRRI